MASYDATRTSDSYLAQKRDGIFKSLVQIGIPMFFYISGIGTTFYNTEKKGFLLFLKSKVLRILIPFVASIFLFLIPRLYFSQGYESWTRPRADRKIEYNFFQFMKLTLPGIITKLSWLWYLPAMFVDFMLTYPLLRWTQRRQKKIPFDKFTDIGIIVHQVVVFVIWALACKYIVKWRNYGEILLVPSIYALAGVYLVFYLFQFLIQNEETGQKYAMIIKLVGPIGSAVLNNYVVNVLGGDSVYHVFLMVNFDAIFFAQGVIDMTYWNQMK